MLTFLYRLWDGHELVPIIISVFGLIISVIVAVAHTHKRKAHNVTVGAILAVSIIILLISLPSGVIRCLYTETPDLFGDTLYEAHHSLSDNNLLLDDAAKQLFMDNLGTSNFVVQAQEPKSGEIVRKNSVVTVTIKDIMNSPEGTDEPPTQNPDDIDTSSISTPAQDTTKPATPTPTTPNSNSTGTENSTDTGDYQPVEPPISDYNTNNPYLDPGFNGNAGVGGGVNSDAGPGDYQPEVP